MPGGVQIPTAPSGCLQYVVPLGNVFFVPAGATSVTLQQMYPSNAGFGGTKIFAQGVVLDSPPVISASNGLRLYLETF